MKTAATEAEASESARSPTFIHRGRDADAGAACAQGVRGGWHPHGGGPGRAVAIYSFQYHLHVGVVIRLVTSTRPARTPGAQRVVDDRRWQTGHAD